MRDALKRITLITAYTTAYCAISTVAWLCDHETVSKEDHHL